MHSEPRGIPGTSQSQPRSAHPIMSMFDDPFDLTLSAHASAVSYRPVCHQSELAAAHLNSRHQSIQESLQQPLQNEGSSKCNSIPHPLCSAWSEAAKLVQGASAAPAGALIPINSTLDATSRIREFANPINLHKDWLQHVDNPIKPPFSFPCLIGLAICSSKSSRMSVRQIYNYIETTFPYFRTAKAGWKNSVRHNLSLSKIFCKLERRDGEDGKGKYMWGVNPHFTEQLLVDILKYNDSYHKRNRSPATPTKATSVAANESKFRISPRKKEAIRPIPTAFAVMQRNHPLEHAAAKSVASFDYKNTGHITGNIPSFVHPGISACPSPCIANSSNAGVETDTVSGTSPTPRSTTDDLLKDIDGNVDYKDEILAFAEQSDKRLRISSPAWEGLRMTPLLGLCSSEFGLQGDLVAAEFNVLDYDININIDPVVLDNN